MINKLIHKVDETIGAICHYYQIFRLKTEKTILKRFASPECHRIMTTACWEFPVYSQTFVYQELTQLLNKGVSLRFLYHKKCSRDRLPHQFNILWKARRRVYSRHLIRHLNKRYFEQKYPQKMKELIYTLSQQTGLTSEELQNHQHFLEAFAVTRLIEAYEPDYLHSYFFYEGTFFTTFAAILLGIPRGVSCYADHLLEDYNLKMMPFHMKHCQIMIATSNRIKQELCKINPEADHDRIIVKPNAINVSAFARTPCPDPEPGNPFHLISVCRIEPKKGLHYLVDAVSRLVSRKCPLRVHIIGGIDDTEASQEYARMLEKKIIGLNLEEIIILEGRCTESEIKAFFNRSHLFIAPFVETKEGDKDGIPTSILEAMASCFPIISTEAGSITEVIDHGVNGWIVPQKDADSLADSIDNLINNKLLRTQLGNNAVEKVQSQFDVSVCEPLFHKQLDKLLQNKES